MREFKFQQTRNRVERARVGHSAMPYYIGKRPASAKVAKRPASAQVVKHRNLLRAKASQQRKKSKKQEGVVAATKKEAALSAAVADSWEKHFGGGSGSGPSVGGPVDAARSQRWRKLTQADGGGIYGGDHVSGHFRSIDTTPEVMATLYLTLYI